MVDKNDPKQLAEAYRITAEYCYKRDYGSMADLLLREADRIDPPHKLDRSLRGWVLVEEPISQSIYWACRKGLQQWILHEDEPDYTWATVEDYGWRVTKLNILQPDEVPVKIPSVSAWPRSATSIRVYYANDRGPVDEILSIDREQAARREDERMMLYSKNDLGQEENQ